MNPCYVLVGGCDVPWVADVSLECKASCVVWSTGTRDTTLNGDMVWIRLGMGLRYKEWRCSNNDEKEKINTVRFWHRQEAVRDCMIAQKGGLGKEGSLIVCTHRDGSIINTQFILE